MAIQIRLLALTVSGAFAANGQWPLLMTHEASSYYFDHQDHRRQGPSSVESSAYTKDQVRSISESLHLGVRAFDIRPYVAGHNKVFLHHGMLQIQKSLDHLFQEISHWRSVDAGTRKEELIVVFLQFDYVFDWYRALFGGAKARSRSNRGEAFKLARKRGWQIFSDAFYDFADPDSGWPCSVFSSILRNNDWLNGTVVIDETCVNPQFDITIHCENGFLPLGMLEGWLYPLKCAKRHEELLTNYMDKVMRDPEVQKDTPRFIQAHFQGQRLVRAETSRQINKRIVGPWLNANVDILKNQPIFIQVDNIAPKSAKCLVAAVKRIQHAGWASANSWNLEPRSKSSLEVGDECDIHDNSTIMVGDESVTYDHVPFIVVMLLLILSLLLFLFVCSCAFILKVIIQKSRQEVKRWIEGRGRGLL